MIGARCRRSILCQILCGGLFDAFVYTAIQAKRFNCAESNPQKWIRNKAGCSRILRNVLCGSIYVNMWWTNNYLQKMSFSFEKWLCSVISLWYPSWLQQTANSKSWIYISLFFGQMRRERDAIVKLSQSGVLSCYDCIANTSPFYSTLCSGTPNDKRPCVSVTMSWGIFCNCCCMYWGFELQIRSLP